MKRKIPNVIETTDKGVAIFLMDARYHLVKQKDGTFAKGKRERFLTRESAQGRAEQIFNDAFQSDHRIQPLRPEVIVDAQRGAQLLQGMPNANLLKAVEFYIAEKQVIATPVAKACDEWFTMKKLKGLKYVSIACIQTRVDRFKEAMKDKMLGDVTCDDLEKWLHAQPIVSTSKVGYRNTICAMLNWAARNKYVDEKLSEQGMEITFPKQPKGQIKILSVSDAKRFWKAAQKADDDIRRYVLLCLFCGLRPMSEAMQLTRDKVHDVEIEVISGKTATARFVHMEPGVREALLKPKWEGPAILPNFKRRWLMFKYNLGYKLWTDPKYHVQVEKDPNFDSRPEYQHDILRHSFCSYHLAKYQDKPKTAHQAGHTVKVLEQHYGRTIPKAEGVAFWKIIEK